MYPMGSWFLASVPKDHDFEVGVFVIPRFVTTIQLAVLVTIGSNVGGLFIALMLNHQGPFYSALRTLFFVPQVLIAVVVSFIWSLILTDKGILNTLIQQMGIS